MNEDIKLAAKKAGVPLYKIGYVMGMSESALSRKLRKQLNDKEREAVYSALERAAARSRDNHNIIDYRVYTRNNRLLSALAKKRIKPKELSERSGVHIATIYGIYHCKCPTVRYSTAYAICDALQCEISDVFPG